MEDITVRMEKEEFYREIFPGINSYKALLLEMKSRQYQSLPALWSYAEVLNKKGRISDDERESIHSTYLKRQEEFERERAKERAEKGIGLETQILGDIDRVYGGLVRLEEGICEKAERSGRKEK